MVDKRQFPRLSEGAKLVCKVVGGPEEVPALAVNISGGGICFRSDVPIQRGASLALELALPGFPAPVIALAGCVWCEPAEEPNRKGFDVGAEFHWIGWDSGAAQQRIADYIHDKLKS